MLTVFIRVHSEGCTITSHCGEGYIHGSEHDTVLGIHAYISPEH